MPAALPALLPSTTRPLPLLQATVVIMQVANQARVWLDGDIGGTFGLGDGGFGALADNGKLR